MGKNGMGGRPRGYRFNTGPCPRCGRECALSYGDPGYIHFRRHNPCGTFRVSRVTYELEQQARKAAT